MASVVLALVSLAASAAAERHSSVFVTGNPHMDLKEETPAQAHPTCTARNYQRLFTLRNALRDLRYCTCCFFWFAQTMKCPAGAAGSCPARTIDPNAVMAIPMMTQADTLQGIVVKRYMGIDIPLYRFKQPARLSPLELPFQVDTS